VCALGCNTEKHIEFSKDLYVCYRDFKEVHDSIKNYRGKGYGKF